MLSRRLLTIIAVGIVVPAYFVFLKGDNRFVALMAICILIFVVTYTFQFQIDWWWSMKKTPKLDPVIKSMIRQSCPYFHKISPEDQEKFEKRMALWVQSKQFLDKGGEDLPEDLKYIVAIAPVLLTIHKEKYLFDGYDQVVFYPHAFLSPHHENDVHCFELETEDGVFIFSIEQMMAGHLRPTKYYDITLHIMAEAYKKKYGAELLPKMSDAVWTLLKMISNISKKKLEDFIGLPQDDPWPVAVHHYFIYPGYFQEYAPELFEQMKRWHEAGR